MNPVHAKTVIKEQQTMIEAHVDVKTPYGYLLYLFHVGFSTKFNILRVR